MTATEIHSAEIRLRELEMVMKYMSEVDHAETPEAVYDCVNRLAEKIGRYTGAERVYVFELDEKGQYFVNTVEWCGETVLSYKAALQRLWVREMPVWFENFKRRRSLVVTDLEDIRNTMPGEYAILKPQGIRSLAEFPLYYGSELLGFVGLDNPALERSSTFLSLLEIVSSHLGAALKNLRSDAKLRRSQALLVQKQQELDREKIFLDGLCREYIAVWYVNALTGESVPLKLSITANASQLVKAAFATKKVFDTLISHYADRFVAEDKAGFVAKMCLTNLRRVLSEKEHYSFRYRSCPNAAGQQYFEVHAFRAKKTDGEFQMMIGFRYVDDIVLEEKKRQNELQQALDEANLKNEIISAISKIYCSIYRMDLVNDTFEEISEGSDITLVTGHSGRATDCLKKICDAYVATDYREAVSRFFDTSTLRERLVKENSIAVEYLTKDGNWHLARFIAKKRNEAGDVLRVLFAIRLISDTKRREENLIVMANEASRANEAKTEFLARIAHDIRTPMNAVKGFVSIIRANPSDTALIEKSLKQIDTASNYLLQIVDDVLDLSKIETGQMQLVPTAASLTAVFEEIEELLPGFRPEKRQHFVCRLHDVTEDCLWMDALRLRQIYIHLLSNAVKYTPAEGTVTFEVSETASPVPGAVRVVSVISDTGIGMSPEYMKEMFNRFSRAVDTRVNKERGSGLGLAVVKELVDLFRGDIRTESELGKGTVITITIDVPKTEKVTADSKTAADGSGVADCRGMRVLIAEDNDINFSVAEALLEMHGIAVDRAENGAECVEKFRAAAPYTYDAILMDIQMPVMNGLEAARMIRQSGGEQAKTIQIIALTANAFTDDIKKSIDAGMNQHLAKPFDINALLSIMGTYRRGRSQTGAKNI